MKIATLVYKKYITSTGVRKKIWQILRKSLIKLLNDPACTLMMHERHLRLPMTHLLPVYLNQFPLYDKLPQRISQYVRQKKGSLNCIDVGANIGDTIASFHPEKTDAFLAIEPNPKFRMFLSENWSWSANITIVSDVCSSGNNKDVFVIQEKNGTASIFYSEKGEKMNTKTLDEIVCSHPNAMDANVLKIDTDGHDFEVIKGSTGLLSRNLPLVLFECDAFEDPSFVHDCVDALNILKQCGYNYFLVYSNYGYLMGKYSLSNLSPFRNLLFYKLTSDFYYFDILVMKDEDMSQFYPAEIHYFAGRIHNNSMRQTAIAAAEL